MKKTTLATSLLAIAVSTSIQAAQETYIIDISDNLYYSGLIPERKTPPFTDANSYSGSFIPSPGYPETAVPWNKYEGTPIGDCVRNVYYVDIDGNERMPTGGEATNSFAPDGRLSCYGSPPVVVSLSEIGVAPGQTMYVLATGKIDDDTQHNYGPGGGIGVVDPRGRLNSDGASDNDINQYAAGGVFVKADTNGKEDKQWCHE